MDKYSQQDQSEGLTFSASRTASPWVVASATLSPGLFFPPAGLVSTPPAAISSASAPLRNTPFIKPSGLKHRPRSRPDAPFAMHPPHCCGGGAHSSTSAIAPCPAGRSENQWYGAGFVTQLFGQQLLACDWGHGDGRCLTAYVALMSS